MKKSNTFNLLKALQGRFLAAILVLFAMLIGSTLAEAQNVTIKATNGSLIASRPQGSTDYDTFFKCGGFATWQHEQLSMVLTASDATDLTTTGQLANPANNLFSDGTHIQIGKGRADGSSQYNYVVANVTYLSLTLPKGYRFTGYNIKFRKPNELTKTGTGTGSESVQFNTADASSTFGETDNTFGTYKVSKTIARNALDSIARTSMSDGDMDNTLYFKFQNPSDSRAMITLESAEFYFTAEADYTPLTTPGNVQRVSAIDIPFATSKVDYGTIESKPYNGVTRVSYSSANVKDLKANFTLYEAGSVTDGADFDGVSGKVVEYKKGSISVENGYYRIGAADAANPGTEEHIYYIETPSYVLLSDNSTKNPVGYRIIGAKIDYKYGVTNKYAEDVHLTYNTFYIRNGSYYLNSTGGATSSSSQRALWFIDEEGYIRTGANGTVYLSNYNSQTGGSGYAGTTQNKANAIKFSITEEGYVYYTDNGTDYWLRRVTSWGSSYFRFQENTGNRATRTMDGTTTVDIIDNIIGTTTQPYTLKVYGKDGTMTGGETQTVNADNASGSIILGGLNNDAVKIGVIGTGLIQGTLTLQALDPYLDKMNVVCQDQTQTAIRMNQTFTASDFSVSGGSFYFYLPADCNGDQVLISFEDLKSKYFDETYTGGSAPHTSRINFVKSAHYNAFGTSNNKIYNDVNEAKNAQLERLKVNTVGTKKFKFNNAADLTNANGILTEYPFSLEKYAAAPNGGSFDQMRFTVSSEDQNLVRYVFTTDETRYNIAPTTAVQHRTYAFYEMDVHVQSGLYEPKVEFKKIYEKTLYGTGQTDAFYGAVITAVDGNGKPGYSSTQEIFRRINECIVNKEDDFEHTDVPDNANKLLYLDFSQLAGVYEITTEEHQSMEDYANTNAKNCMIFIPMGQSAPNNNVAYKTESGGFMAANDIILTDKEPFYTPHDIQVHSANKAEYKRKITKDKYGKVQNASLILPFVITVDNSGTHTNLDGSKFSLHTMQSTSALTLQNGTTYAYFPELSNVTVTEANMPYLVQLTENSSEDGVSFVVSQNGTLIKATTAMAASDYTFTGATSTGTATGGEASGTWSFTSKGTYAGAQIVKGDNVFYFANNHFVNSGNLNSEYSYANIAPFRAYFATPKSSGAKLSSFDVIFGEGIGDVPTGMQAVDAAELINVDEPVYDMQGRMVATSYRELANKSKKLQSGLYVVNGVKIMIK